MKKIAIAIIVALAFLGGTIIGKTSEPPRVRRVFTGRPWASDESIMVLEDDKKKNVCYVLWTQWQGTFMSCVHSPEPIPIRTQW